MRGAEQPDSSINDGARGSALGTRFLVYPQVPHLSGYRTPEAVWISTPPGIVRVRTRKITASMFFDPHVTTRSRTTFPICRHLSGRHIRLPRPASTAISTSFGMKSPPVPVCARLGLGQPGAGHLGKLPWHPSSGFSPRHSSGWRSCRWSTGRTRRPAMASWSLATRSADGVRLSLCTELRHDRARDGPPHGLSAGRGIPRAAFRRRLTFPLS